jgi:hypothetical protein
MTRLRNGKTKGIIFRFPAVLIYDFLFPKAPVGYEGKSVFYSVLNGDKGVLDRHN